MLKPLIEFNDVVTVIPNSGIQMLDFGLEGSAVASVVRSFWPQPLDERDDLGRTKVRLHPLAERGEDLVYFTEELPQGRRAPEDQTYDVRATEALDTFNGEWLPAPFLRRRIDEDAGESAFDYGPVGWCRMRVVKLDEADEAGNTHRIVLAFDTTLGPPKTSDAPYLAPEPRDSSDPVEFQLACDPFKIGFFVESVPVRRWIRDMFFKGLKRRFNRPIEEDEREPGEFWGTYFVLLEAVAGACRIPRIKLIDTVTDPQNISTIGIDLVIDVGNSRTCGILVEKAPGRDLVDITQATRLELRDLTRPEFVYSQPFETWVEFSPAQFGSQAHARRLSQKNTFWWPSLVRVGPEASWLAAKSDGTEGITGLSSPKRYLWDDQTRPQAWSNTRGLTPAGQEVPDIKGPMVARLAEDGRLTSMSIPVGTSPRYSRSSIYMLMLVELLSHALVQINSLSFRSQKADRDLPRRLENIILTLPSATPIAEQKILKRRANDACNLLWDIMGWKKLERAEPAETEAPEDPLHKKPAVKMDWDEATCTHLVYLYNETNHKFQSDPSELFSMISQGRTGSLGGPAVRIASIDIGGGTSDLMIIQHEVESQSKRIVHPQQMFREGFRLAGDDLLKVVIEECVLPQFVTALRNSGVAQAGNMMTELFGGNHEGMSQQDRTLRATFVNQVLVPVALSLLSLYEQTEGRRGAGVESSTVADLLDADHAPQRHVRAYLETAAKKNGAAGFDIDQVKIDMDPQELAGIVISVFGSTLEDLCDVVRYYQCDLLLLTGRPSRLPVVRDIIHSQIPLPPHRVVSMHRYEISPWYPFRKSSFEISDPKTTAVVGAMLCQVCEGRIEGFYMKSSELQMESTARYIGVMNQAGQITEDNVLLDNVNLKTGDGVIGFDLAMEGPTFLGFRQLPLARWKTTPLYYMSFRNPDDGRTKTLAPPIALHFERSVAGDDASDFEDFKPRVAIDANDKPCLRQVDFRLQTLKTDQSVDMGYWLDSGILRTSREL